MSDVHAVTFEGSGPWAVHTINSTYRVKRDPEGGWLVTRMNGRFNPTPRTGEDGVWKHAESVEMVFGSLFILWQGTQGTLTSLVQSIDCLCRS